MSLPDKGGSVILRIVRTWNSQCHYRSETKYCRSTCQNMSLTKPLSKRRGLPFEPRNVIIKQIDRSIVRSASRLWKISSSPLITASHYLHTPSINSTPYIPKMANAQVTPTPKMDFEAFPPITRRFGINTVTFYVRRKKAFYLQRSRSPWEICFLQSSFPWESFHMGVRADNEPSQRGCQILRRLHSVASHFLKSLCRYHDDT